MNTTKKYPIKRSEEAKVTRRGFAKFVGFTSVTMFLGNLFGDNLKFLKPHLNEDRKPAHVANLEDLPVGKSIVVRYPTKDSPCLIIRLAEHEFVAYDQRCTHLMCPVTYDVKNSQLYCPCHAGYFDAKTGNPTAGPPKKSLPKYEVEVKGVEIWLR